MSKYSELVGLLEDSGVLQLEDDWAVEIQKLVKGAPPAGDQVTRRKAAPVPPTGDVEVLAYVIETPSTLYFSTRIEPGENYTELVDRAHVTRLTAERDGHAHNSKEWESASLHWMAEYDKVKAELTKALELLNSANGQLEVCAFGLRAIATSKGVTAVNLRQMAKSALNSAAGIASQPATPIAHNVDESCGQDAEAAKGEQS